jgi:hypothetical protein
MTRSAISTPSSRASRGTGERHVVVSEPRPRAVVELAPGSQLAVRFRPRLGASRWHVTGLPGNVLVLAEADGREFQLLVFDRGPDRDGASTLVRFELRHPERETAYEVCELLVVPLSDDRVRASGPSASRRTA